MERADVISLMKFISLVYQNFEVNDPAKIQVWEMLLKDEDYNDVQRMAVDHCKTEKFPPVPADLIPKKHSMTVYDHQQLEREQDLIELQEYHENNKTVPMPDYILKELQSMGGGDDL
ncbi:hypothetical protein [Paenibacillus taichungensis]|uniref:hypothetical protein n=1 Tax=Paenibacillus taichungensis TaxID=484184 RepID=UPI0039A72AEC